MRRRRCWFSWMREAPRGSRPKPCISGFRRASPLPLTTDIQFMTWVRMARADTPEQRLDKLLIALFEAYCRADGNNAARFRLVEALAFALSRCLGSCGEYEKAVPIVEHGLEPPSLGQST